MFTCVFFLSLLVLKSVCCTSIGRFVSASASEIKYQEALVDGRYTLRCDEVCIEHKVSLSENGLLDVFSKADEGPGPKSKYFPLGKTGFLIFFPLTLGVDLAREFDNMFLPKNADFVRNIIAKDMSPEDMLEELSGMDFSSGAAFVVTYLQKTRKVGKQSPVKTDERIQTKGANIFRVPGHKIYKINLEPDFEVRYTRSSIEIRELNGFSHTTALRIQNGKFDRVARVHLHQDYDMEIALIREDSIEKFEKGSVVKSKDVILVLIYEFATESDDDTLRQIVSESKERNALEVALKLAETEACIKRRIRVLALSGEELIHPEPHRCVYEAMFGKEAKDRKQPYSPVKSRLSHRLDFDQLQAQNGLLF